MNVTEEGIFISFNEEQFLKVSFSIRFKGERIEMFIKDKQRWKQLQPISITDSGIVISDKEEHSLNAYSAIALTEEGIVIRANEEQPLNTSLSIRKIEGMLISINDEHSRKAESPMVVTEGGITIRSNDLHL
ncbi:hypothetical protein M9Y10_031594 [Tritrichomonas musculus]|uniref:Uncharacterized protein n=1 Tax=Tritrichomonas musculus TaxID=1915356 RepID=A0ABR2H1U5_9EUKA